MSDRMIGDALPLAKDTFIYMNSSILKHKMKEGEEVHSFKLAMDRGDHHGQTMVSFSYGSTFLPCPTGVGDGGIIVMTQNVPK